MPGRDLTLLTEAARAAGKIAARHFNNAPKVWDKGGGQGPVTEADLEIDKMLKALLLGARPDYGWLSEESEDGAARQTSEHVFIIDPIDGTRSFINGDKTFAHSLAIARHGEVVAAVVHLPLLQLTYTAHQNGGAYLNGTPVQPSDVNQLQDARVLAAKPMMHPDLWRGGVPPVQRHFRSSLAYRMCLIAEGKFDAMLTLRGAWEWDIAAGDLICREAGLTVTDKHNKALIFNNPHPQTAGVLAANVALHHALISHL